MTGHNRSPARRPQLHQRVRRRPPAQARRALHHPHPGRIDHPALWYHDLHIQRDYPVTEGLPTTAGVLDAEDVEDLDEMAGRMDFLE